MARRWMEKLPPRAGSQSVFRGFLFYYGAAPGDILHGDEMAEEIGLVGTKGLATPCHQKSGLIALGAEAEEAISVGGMEATSMGSNRARSLLGWRNFRVREMKICVTWRLDMPSPAFEYSSARTSPSFNPHLSMKRQARWSERKPARELATIVPGPELRHGRSTV